MISVNIPWLTLFYIFLCLVYMVSSKHIRKLPDIPIGLLTFYFVLVFFKTILSQYMWSTDWLRYIGISADIILSWGIARIVFWAFMGILSKFKDEKDVPPKITRDFILFITFVILFLLVLRAKSDINLASLATTSAALTVVIGLAVQATLNNFFSGLIIQAEQPFAIGDWLKFDGAGGRQFK